MTQGRILRLQHESSCLRGNRLGDPYRRELPVYLPPGYEAEPARHYPVVFYLAGFMGIGESKLAWRPWGETFVERLDRLQLEGALGPTIVVFPDCFTKLGGSQYIDSSASGDYDRYLGELVEFVDRELRTLPGPRHRAVAGKSSGGFGAIVQGMLHPERWSAVACHSGDSYFEFCFLTDLPKTLNEINRFGSVSDFLEGFYIKKKRSPAMTHAIMHLAMAACFDPLPDHRDGFQLPVDLQTGVLVPERWERWLAWDPVRMIPNYSESLKRLGCLFVDCGSKDQYHLHYGARQMKAALDASGVPVVYEEFSDNHSNIDYRLDRSIPLLYQAIRSEVTWGP